MHRLSPAAKGRFAVCNCLGRGRDPLRERAVWIRQGGVTGAAQDKPGLFRVRDGGTVFLDEIGDMPLDTQSKLLRTIENGEIQRVGSPGVRRVDVRVVAATNRNLPDLMARRQFREDLFYRLSMVEVSLPRLAERKEDLPLLERFFLEQFAGQYNKPIRRISPRAQILLARHSWPATCAS